MKYIETRITIPATPEAVWDVLMDFPSYPDWNPMVVGISGSPDVGSRLKARIAMKTGRTMTFRPTVVEFVPGRRFAWRGKLWVRGLFDGLHRFAIEDNGDSVTFVHSEEFRGLLPPVLGKLLNDTHDSLIAMNEALAREVERRGNAGLPGSDTRPVAVPG